MKADIYESLHVINSATRQIVEHVDRLKAEGLLIQDFAEIRKLAVEQTCAEIGLSAVLALCDREQNDAARMEKTRIEIEERLKSS